MGFLTTIRTGFFYASFTFSNFYLDFYFPFFIGLLFSLFSLDFYSPFLFGFLFPFFLRTFIFCLDVYSIAVTFWISFKFFTYFLIWYTFVLMKIPEIESRAPFFFLSSTWTHSKAITRLHPPPFFIAALPEVKSQRVFDLDRNVLCLELRV